MADAQPQEQHQLTRVDDHLCVSVLKNGKCVRVLEPLMCCSLWTLDGKDKLFVNADDDVDLYDSKEPISKAEAKKITKVKDYRDRFGQQIEAMVEQLDGERFWFTSLNKATRFMALHGMTDVPAELFEKLQDDAGA